MSGFPAGELKLIKQRSKGICEGCGLNQATEAHHRQYRSRGGPDTAVNALHLCGSGNHSGCHGRAHNTGEKDGWSIRSGFDPALVPALVVVDYTARWVRFTPDGGREVIPEGDALEYMALIGVRVVS